MPSRGPAALLAALVLGAAVATGCQAESRDCTPSPRLVPRCGVLWGITTDPNTTSRVRAVERDVGTHFDMIYRFHDLDDRVPTRDERALVASGRVLHLAIDPRIFTPPGRQIPWARVSAGAFDRALAADARGIASLMRPVFVTFGHEPDKPAPGAGPPRAFVRAWRHVHDLFVRAGASNAVWVWVVTGYWKYFDRAGMLWPGNRYVDWISWEAYNRSGCTTQVDPAAFRTFAESALPFLHWLRANGPSNGIDLGKPMMISEAASARYPTDPQLTASWYRDIPLVLLMHPAIKAVGLWDHPGVGGCRFQFDRDPVVADAVRVAGQSAAVRGTPPGG